MNKQDYAYLVHTIKNANAEMKKIRRKFNKEKAKILKLKRVNKTRKKRRQNIIFFLHINEANVGSR